MNWGDEKERKKFTRRWSDRQEHGEGRDLTERGH